MSQTIETAAAPERPEGEHRSAESLDEYIIKVASGASTNSLASSIAQAVYEGLPVTLRAIGAPAVNQAAKAVAAANGFTAPRGYMLSARPFFLELQGNLGDTMMGMGFHILVHR